jgi:hypothetical protein
MLGGALPNMPSVGIVTICPILQSLIMYLMIFFEGMYLMILYVHVS